MSDVFEGAETQEELERFRREWQAELRHVQAKTEPEGAFPSRLTPPSSAGVPFLPTRSARSEVDISADATAVEVYAAAVEAERSARLNEATVLYRRAFKLDSDVERAYHAYSVVKTEEPKLAEENDNDLAFNFARTIQLGDDYVDPQASDAATHPSSSYALRQKVLRAIASHPFVRPKEEEKAEPEPETDQHVYHAQNENLPIYFARLPTEVVVQILLHVVLPRDVRFYPQIHDLEVHFARICRHGRLDSLEPALWRAVCERVYRFPQISAGETISRLVVRKHGGDWRRMYLSQPRMRTDGCFIGVQRYVRRGYQESAWISPSYSVTYFRFLRMYSDGRCVSLQTTIEPGEIVRQLQPDLRIAGLLTGTWTLSTNGILRCKLEDPALPVDKRKYSFQLEARLKSSTRGRMNKLEILRLATCRCDNDEVDELPLNPDHARPFYFSPVPAWER